MKAGGLQTMELSLGFMALILSRLFFSFKQKRRWLGNQESKNREGGRNKEHHPIREVSRWKWEHIKVKKCKRGKKYRTSSNKIDASNKKELSKRKRRIIQRHKTDVAQFFQQFVDSELGFNQRNRGRESCYFSVAKSNHAKGCLKSLNFPAKKLKEEKNTGAFNTVPIYLFCM